MYVQVVAMSVCVHQFSCVRNFICKMFSGVLSLLERDSVDGMVQSRECHDLLHIICSET